MDEIEDVFFVCNTCSVQCRFSRQGRNVERKGIYTCLVFSFKGKRATYELESLSI